MSIDLRKLVDINIESVAASSYSSTRDTVILFCGFDTGLYTKLQALATPVTKLLCSKTSDYTSLFTGEGSDTPNTYIKRYLDIYFDNRGLKLLLVALVSGIDDSTQIGNYIDSSHANYLGDEYIIFAYTDGTSTGTSAHTFSATEFASSQVGVKPIHKKCFLISWLTYESANLWTTENLFAKYGAYGIEMTIGAYLSRININDSNVVQDYAFTPEIIDDTDLLTDAYANSILASPKLNGDIYLAGSNRNIGGNDCSNKDIVNQYLLIVLQQTLTEKLINVLVTKIKYDQYGISAVTATIINELDIYRNAGYLSLDKVWTYDDLVYENKTLLKKGEALTKGYKFMIMPFSTLTAQEIAQHKFPNIYIAIATSYGIRFIQIEGKAY